jgi:hypothetical protein
MALFVDGYISTLQDLKAQESSVLDMASNEGVDLTSKLILAQRELATILEDFLRDNSEGGTQAISLDNVALSEPIRRWHCLRALMLAYRDAYQSQPSDRYRAKFEMYRGLAAEAGAQALSRGLGVILNPIHDADGTDYGQAPNYYVLASQRIRRG